VESSASILEAARKMTDHRVSSLLVVDGNRLTGIVTDRDLRSRVIAQGLSYERPVLDAMTASPLTVSPRDYTHDALIEMARNGFHHLPVVEGERVVGMITSTDILQRRSASPLYVISEIYRCDEVACLAEAARRLPQLLSGLVDANASAHSIGHIVTSVGEAVTNRLLALGEREFGPAPVPYAWVAGGSQARNEQTALSDQDNCLLLSDDYEQSAHGEYFARLAHFVCDGLDASGYIYCPGEIMATTPKWRQPLAAWKRYFEKWIDQPRPEALLNATVFFDLRLIHGDLDLFRCLQEHYLTRARSNRIFLAYMAANALQFQPPLGFFRNFVLVKGGEHDHTLDLKHRGVVPIIDLARVYALAAGVGLVNTRDRLEQSVGADGLSSDGAADLRDALELISAIRLRHQARQAKGGRKPDNFVSPADLSHFERNHLKDAFGVVRTMQASLAQRFQTARFG
jgi:CBS domain-containing protein